MTAPRSIATIAGRDREAARADHGEAEEDDVAGHVGDEDMAELQVADSIDDTRDEREREHQRRQRAVPVARAGPQGRGRFLGQAAQGAVPIGEAASPVDMRPVLTRPR